MYQASRDVPKAQGANAIPKAMRDDSKFNKDSKVFFGGDVDDSSSAYGRAAQAFYGQGQGGERVDPKKTLGGKFENI